VSDDSPDRLRSLDALRGAAVVVMVAWHTTDGWLAEAYRAGPAWTAARVAGGLAAPLFLLAAGAAVGLRLRRGHGLGAVLRRAATLIVLGWVLRLQIWLVDAGALLEPRSWPALLSGAAGCGLALWALRDRGRQRPADAAARAPGRCGRAPWALRDRGRQRSADAAARAAGRCGRAPWALRDRGRQRPADAAARAPGRRAPHGLPPRPRGRGRALAVAVRRAARRAAGGGLARRRRERARAPTADAVSRPFARRAAAGALAALLLTVAVHRLHADAPERLALVLRVDVLSCIGASVALTAGLARLGGARALAAGAALTIALTHPLRELVGLGGPPALTAWVARSLDATNRSFAAFPIVPWSAWAMIGGAIASRPRARPRLPVVALLGLALAVVGYEGGLPWVRRLLHEAPALRPAARLVFYGGLALVAAALAAGPPRRALAPVGRASLPIYWIHLELAFGLAAIPLHRRLEPVTSLAASAALVAISGWAAHRWLAPPKARAARRVEGGSRAHTFARRIDSSPNPRA
jgi:uncharacterized membrane protein